MKIYVMPDPNEKWTERLKREAQAKLRETGEWFNRNKEAILILAPVGIGAITKVVSVVGRNINLRKEKRSKQLDWYDPSLGGYWTLRRPLKNNERLEVEARHKAGEALGSIFRSMKVLR